MADIPTSSDKEQQNQQLIVQEEENKPDSTTDADLTAAKTVDDLVGPEEDLADQEA